MALVLVSGATGYLGSNCVKALLEAGYRVRGTVRSLKNAAKNAPIEALDKTGGRRLELVEADLNKADGWQKAVDGCDYVLHVASPFPLGGTQETIDTAINGTRHVLEACAAADSVKKVVLTSSIVAVGDGHKEAPFTESDWTNVETCNVAYAKSKTLAEKFAWEFVAKNDKNQFKLTVINPGLIVGPLLTDDAGSSVEIIRTLYKVPAVPRITLSCIDVRDCAQAHVRALSKPEADGLRILAVEFGARYYAAIGEALNKEFQSQGYCATTRTLPDIFIKLGAFFSSQLGTIVSRLGDEPRYDNSRLKSVLGLTPRDSRQSIVEMVYDLIERGHLKKTAKYRGKPQTFD